MKNNILKIKKDLKSFAKRTKDFKYSDKALFTFLITGMLFSFSVNSFSTSDASIEKQVVEINSGFYDLKQSLKNSRLETEKLIKDSNLELVQLMKQGDQVVKSPWSSWQIGINTFMSGDKGTRKGKGDKSRLYSENHIYKRGEWWENNTPLTSNQRGSLSSSTTTTSSLVNQRQGLLNGEWGLVKFDYKEEPKVTVELSAAINPKTIPPIVAPIAPTPNIPVAPKPIAINPSVPTPPVAPKIEVPVVSPIAVNVGTLPTITSPTINVTTIKAPTNPTIPNIQLGTFGSPNLVMTDATVKMNGGGRSGATITTVDGKAGVG